MQRQTLIMGNWKMSLGRAEARGLASSLKRELAQRSYDCDVAVCPSFPHLAEVQETLQGSVISVGAQDCVAEAPGAVTGGVSAQQLVEIGLQWVILGHSERRSLFGETDELLSRKLATALESGLRPVLCVGESLEEREQGRTREVVLGQLAGSTRGIAKDQARDLTVAYEPVWAIGTGRSAQPEDVAEVHAALRESLAPIMGSDGAQSCRILYGGSVKPDNVASYLALEDVDGALVGGASLAVESFLGLLAEV